MKRQRMTITALASLASLSFATSVGASVSVPITNAGFEDPVLADGQLDLAGPFDGWAPFNGGDIGVLNPGTTDFTAEAPEGSNVGYVSQTPGDGGHAQMLSGATGQLQADASYRLTVQVGNSAYVAGFPGYRVQLRAGGTLLAEDDNTLAPVEGLFVASTVNYTYTVAESALVGQPMEIRLLSKGGAGDEVAFDDVQLTVALTNPVAGPGGPYGVKIPTGSLSLDGSGSLPSDGRAITTYQWDLDNDGTYDITGVTPAAIPYAALTGTYGMTAGDNTIKLRVTDDSLPTPKTSISEGTVTLFEPVSTYIGDNNARNDRWNLSASWDTGAVPSGADHVVIPDGKLVNVWSNGTPAYTGDLSIGVNATQQFGWTTQYPNSYNALGTPGSTTISMAEGAKITMRTGGSVSMPAIQLVGNATIIMGQSTQPSADPTFGQGISGAYTLTLQGKGGCDAYLTAATSFSALVADPLYGSNFNINANLAGSLGGDVTILPASNGAICANLIINAADAMADTATLTLNGPGSTTKLTLNADDTIAKLVIDGVTQPVGTYGQVGSGTADYEVPWLSGSGILTVVGTSTFAYWDINDTAAGAGGPTPAGTWDAVNTYWNAAADGTGSTAAWSAGQAPAFAAGTDATGTYTVTVDGTQDIAGLAVEEGTVTLSGGTALRMTDDSYLFVDSGLTATIATPISDDATARHLSKGGDGTLVLSGTNAYTGVTRLEGGSLSVANLANAGVDSPIGNYPTAGEAGLVLVSGTFQYTGGTATIDRGFTLSGVSTIDMSAAGTALTLGACDSAGSPGTLTVTGGAGSSLSTGEIRIVEGANPTLNPTTVSMTVASARGYTSYPIAGSSLTLDGTSTGNVVTGTLTQTNPPGSGYLRPLNLTKSGTGEWTLSGSSNYSGTTSVKGGTLIAGTNAPNNGNGAFGKATSDVALGVAGGDDDATIFIGGPHTIGRKIRIATSNNTDAGTRVLTLGGNTADASAFSNDVCLGTTNNAGYGVTLTAASGGEVTFSGVIQDPSGMDPTTYTVTKTGDGTVVFANANTYTGDTVVSAGTLALVGGSQASAITVQSGAKLGFALGSPTTSTAALTLDAGHAISINGTPVDPSYTLMTATSITGTPTLETAILNYELVVESGTTLKLNQTGGTSPYDTWAGGFVGLTDSTPALDFDGGGLATGIEWVTGGDPTDDTDDAGLAPTGTIDATGTYLVFTYRRSDAAEADARTAIKAEYGTDLQGWTEAQNGVDGVVITVTDDGAGTGVDIVEVKIPMTLATPGGALYARLNVVVTPNQPGGPPYDTWAGGFVGLTDSTPTLDADGGGLATGIEWVTGGDPTDDTDDAGLAPTGTIDATGTYLVFTYRRSDAAEADARTAIKAEYGTTLQGWTEAQDTVDGVVITVTDDGAGTGIDLVEVKIPMSLAAPGREFYARLNVTITP